MQIWEGTLAGCVREFMGKPISQRPLNVTLTNQPPPPSPNDFMDRLRSAATDHWNTAMRQPCPDVPGVRIEVGDLEIDGRRQCIA